MSKFCTSCGTQLADDATFCTTCGTAQQVQQSQQGQSQQVYAQQVQQSGDAGFAQAASGVAQAAGNAAQAAGNAVKQTFDGVTFDSVKDSMSVDNIKNIGKTKNKNTIIGLCAVAVVLIIVVIILCSIFGGKSYEKPIKYMCKAIENADGDALEKAFPDYLNEMADDYFVGDDYDSVSEYYEEQMEDALDALEDEYGSNIKISYDVIKKKEIKESDLEDLEDEISDYYDEDVKVTKGYQLKVELTIKGKEDDDTETDWINVYKIDGDWVITNSVF